MASLKLALVLIAFGVVWGSSTAITANTWREQLADVEAAAAELLARPDASTAAAAYDGASRLGHGLSTAGVCEPEMRKALAFAAAVVHTAESYDSGDLPELEKDSQKVRSLRVLLPRSLPTCRGAVKHPARVELVSPLDGEAFPGSVTATVPAAATRAQLLVDGLLRNTSVLEPGARFVTFDVRRGLHRAVQVRFLEGNRTVALATSRDVWALPPGSDTDIEAGRQDAQLERRLRDAARGFPGVTGIRVENLRTGVWADISGDRVFPAASTVKLAVFISALGHFGPRPERSVAGHDLAGLAFWSSNLAANRLLDLLGGTEADGARIARNTLARLGAESSTYPGAYRVGTVRRQTSARVTTARDLARILHLLHASAAGIGPAARVTGLTTHEARVGVRLLLGWRHRGANWGLLGQPAAARKIPLAQKSGWIREARHSAALVFDATGPWVVVVLTDADAARLGAAQVLGSRVLRLVTTEAPRE